MRKTFGAVCMIAGVVLIVGALALLIYNNVESNKAEQLGKEVVSQMKEAISDSEKQTEKETQMTEIEIDGYNYIGYISIPSQAIELPVMSKWDYPRLRIAPCRYSGTITENNMVVIAHNYHSHFGNLDQLEIEDDVLFTDVTGIVTAYKVACVDVVSPTSVEEVVAGDFDLTLVTCTYSGKTRLVVYCDEAT